MVQLVNPSAILSLAEVKVFGDNSTAQVQQKQTLWDFRNTDDERQTDSTNKNDAVFKYLFGNKWDNDLTITSSFLGSFTKANTGELLQYVGGCDEGQEQGFKATQNCAHAFSWSAGWIGIFDSADSTKPIMKLPAALGYKIGTLTDVNGDGINEILSFNGFSNHGETTKGATFGQITDGKYQE